MTDYNLVVIGGGSAGLVVAAGAAGLGAKVALVERGLMGGDCLNYGCVPSKALVHSGQMARQMRLGGLGLPPAAGLPDWSKVAARVQSVIDTIAPHDSVERFTSLGVDVVQGTGRLSGGTTVEVELNAGGTRQISAKALVLAAGSGPVVPPIPGLAEAGFQTNETVFSMTSQPRRLLVVGGGPIGLELGQAFQRLGSEVTIIEMAPRVMVKEDTDVSEVIRGVLEGEGLKLLAGAKLERVETLPDGKRAHYSSADAQSGTVDVDEVLLAVGRRAVLDSLNLEAAGVAMEKGYVKVNERLQTSNPAIFACGDIAGPYLFTHMANQQARVVIQNALLPLKTRIDYNVVPWCTFTEPEVARVGLSEEEAQAGGIAYRTIKIPMAGMDRAVCEDAREGFLKVLTPPKGDAILGAVLVGAHAGEIIHEFVLAMRHKLRLRDLAATVHVYPTLAEIVRRAGDESRKAGFTPMLQRLFRGYMAWQRR